MLTVKDVSIVYETLLSAPGMQEPVKVNFSLSRKHVWLLAKVIEHGLLNKDKHADHSLLQTLDEPSIQTLQQLCEELLHKGGLTLLNEKLQSLSAK